MNEYPLVSILIPVYMRPDLVVEAIESALSQDYPNIEIIVGDNCSTDSTYEVLCQKYGDDKRISLFQNESNLGALGNWKQCLNRANGKYIKFLWSDDVMANDFVSCAVDMLETDSEISFAFSSVYIFENNVNTDGGDDSLQLHYRMKKRTGVYTGRYFIDMTYRAALLTPVSPGCALFRRDKVQIISDIPNTIGYEHKRNGAGPDLLMFLEALANNEKIAYIDKPCNYFRKHEGSISSSDGTVLEGYWTAKLYYLEKYGFDKYWKMLNSEIIISKNQNDIFSKKRNTEAVKKYYRENDDHIFCHSVLGVLTYKLRNKVLKMVLE